MLKKLLIAASLFVSVTASAQLNFGVKAGTNLSCPTAIQVVERNASNSNYEFSNTYDVQFGFHLGGYANYTFDKRLGMQGEALISLYNGLYLDIPLLLSVKPFKMLPYSIMVGMQLSMTPTVHINGYDSNKAGSPIDFFPALAMGIRYDFSKHLNVEFRYIHGFTKTYDYSYSTPDAYHSQEGYYSESGAKNRVVQLSVGWTF